MVKSQFFIALALLMGVAIGYFANDKGHTPATVEEKAVKVSPIRDVGVRRDRVVEVVTNVVTITNEVNRNGGGFGRGGDWRQRMDELKKNDPAAFAQMTNRVAQWRMSRARRVRGQMEFLTSIDISGMGEDAQATHNGLLEMIANREELEEQMQNPDLTNEERSEILGEMRKTHQEIERLRMKERKILLDETAKNMGFSGEDVKEITTTIQEIIEATDNGFGGRRSHESRRSGRVHQ